MDVRFIFWSQHTVATKVLIATFAPLCHNLKKKRTSQGSAAAAFPKKKKRFRSKIGCLWTRTPCRATRSMCVREPLPFRGKDAQDGPASGAYEPGARMHRSHRSAGAEHRRMTISSPPSLFHHSPLVEVLDVESGARGKAALRAARLDRRPQTLSLSSTTPHETSEPSSPAHSPPGRPLCSKATPEHPTPGASQDKPNDEEQHLAQTRTALHRNVVWYRGGLVFEAH